MHWILSAKYSKIWENEYCQYTYSPSQYFNTFKIIEIDNYIKRNFNDSIITPDDNIGLTAISYYISMEEDMIPSAYSRLRYRVKEIVEKSQSHIDLYRGCNYVLYAYEDAKITFENNLNQEKSILQRAAQMGIAVYSNNNSMKEDVNNIFNLKSVQKDITVIPKGNSIEKLNSLIGLNNIKEDVNGMVNLMKMQIKRQQQGLKAVPVSLHLVFTGNPGTGKTTIARILAEIYKEIGILSQGQLVEVDRSGLVAGYVGQTAIKTQEKINEALGGILFIDEAYTLVKEGQDYGQEAIDTLLKAMEDHRDDFIVIVAGYSDLMQNFINSNLGLKSRFNKCIDFPDYSGEELVEIFYSMCKEYQYTLTPDADKILKDKIFDMEKNKDKNFANARDVRNLFEMVITKQATRLSQSNTENIMEIDALDI